MKYGRVLTYKDIEEAKKLIGKTVLFSENLQDIEENPLTCSTRVLDDIQNGEFIYYEGSFEKRIVQFIREVIEEPTYRPFTCEEARKHIGKVVRRDRDVMGTNFPQYNIIHSVVQESAKKLFINGVKAEEFCKNWVFDDTNKSCGTEVEE